MVNNYDRIYAEIERHASRMTPKGVDPNALVELIMEVVFLEDRKVARIRQKVENSVRAVAVGESRSGEPESSEEGATASAEAREDV